MRRALWPLLIAALVGPSGAPARSLCATASTLSGAAPLTVTFSSTCGAVHWDFGDGQSADGDSVTHTYAAGAWTVVAGSESVGVVVAKAVSLRVPGLVGYRHRLTFRGSIVPPYANRQVLILAGTRLVASARTDGSGLFHATRRISGPGPYAARFDEAESETFATTVKPQLDVRLVGAPTIGGRLAVVARVVPARAGTARIRVWRRTRLVADTAARRVLLDTNRVTTYRVRVTTTANPGFTTRARTLAAVVAYPFLSRGARGPSVHALEQRLHELHVALARIDASYDSDTVDAVVAFQKLHGLPRTGSVDRVFWRTLGHRAVTQARYGGNHVEVDKTRQLLFEVRHGRVELIVPVSTGATGNTPIGVWHVYRRIPGWSWVLWYPTYFLRGFAIHGYPSVPAYPASHGCVRVPMWVATRLFAMHAYGFPIYIYY